MAELSRYVCPNCNGVVQFSSDTSEVTCEFCGSTFAVDELKAPEIGDEERVQFKSSEHANTVDDFLKRAPWGSGGENLVSHTCSTCGAEIVCDQATVATNCPYCGNVMMASDTLSGHQPQLVIPFKVDRGKAEEILGGHVKGKWYLPKEFEAQLQHLQGVYVPYYLYSGNVNGWAWYDGEKDRTVGSGDERRTVTDHVEVYREAKAGFTRIPVNGSSKMPDGHMDAIEPFDYNELKPFTVGYLAGYLAEVADEDADDRWSRAHDRAENTFDDMLAHDARRHVDRVSRENHDTNIELDEVETTMIPVWLMHCTWEDQDMLFAVNGQTGRIVGDMPHDSGKRTLTIIVSALIALAIWALFTFVIFKNGVGTKEIIFAIAACIIVPLVVDGFFMGQVRTANIRTDADDAIEERGFFEITNSQG